MLILFLNLFYNDLISILILFSSRLPQVEVLSQWRGGPLQFCIEIVPGKKSHFVAVFTHFYLSALIYANYLKLLINYFSKGESTLCTIEDENHRETAFLQS